MRVPINLEKLIVEKLSCLLCKSNEIKDEAHFPLHCVVHEKVRSNLFKSITQKIQFRNFLSGNRKFDI